MNICLNCKVSSETQHNCDDIINEDPEIICQCFCNENSLAEDDVEIIINSRPKSFFDILFVVSVILAVVAFAIYRRMNS